MIHRNRGFSLLKQLCCNGPALATVFLTVLIGCGQNLGSPQTHVEEAKQAVAEKRGEIEFRVKRASFVLVRIPPGETEIGSPTNEKGHQPNESPIQRIRISKAFYLGRHEVTQLQYRETMGDNPSTIRGDSLPVFEISYHDAIRFCERLTEQVGLSVTLPTEAQWEYACRAGARTSYSSGDTAADLDEVGWYRENAGGTVHPVGEKRPNALGLYDMHGNVCELCADFLDYEHIQYLDPGGERHRNEGAMRGGAWMQPAELCRAAARQVSDVRFKGMGIRIAIDCETEKGAGHSSQ